MMWENAWNSKTARAALCITHTPSKQMLTSWSLLPFLAFFILENLSRICVYYFMARLLFYNTYIQIDPDKTNTIRDQNLFNRIKLNSWAGLVSVSQSLRCPFCKQATIWNTQDVWHTTQAVLCFVTLVTHPFHSYLVFPSVLQGCCFYNFAQGRSQGYKCVILNHILHVSIIQKVFSIPMNF